MVASHFFLLFEQSQITTVTQKKNKERERKMTEVKKITDIKELPHYEEIESGAFAQKWIEIGLTEGPRVSEADIRKLFEYLELELNVIIWARDPVVAGRALRLSMAGVDVSGWNGKDIDPEWVEAQMSKVNPPKVNLISEGYCRYGQHDASWVANALAYEGTDIDLSEIKLYEPIVRGASWFFHDAGVAIFCERVAPKLDADGNLHCVDGPAIWTCYALFGQVLTESYEWVVKERETLTRKRIDTIENAEVRRVTIAAYPDKYIEGGPIQSDDYGELYDLPGENYRVVKVMDPYKPSPNNFYWLRVPPSVQTAHEGVASTFGKSAQEYKPSIQS